MGLLNKIILDRDTKFLLDFWREVYNIVNIKLSFTIVYYKNTNRQLEHSNQTLIYALHYAITELFNQSI